MDTTIILADYASTEKGGRFVVAGGGVDVLEYVSLPATQALLSLVVRVQFSAEELGRQYSIQLSFLDPDGHPFQPPHALQLAPVADPETPERAVPFQFVYHLRSAEFRAWGRHTIVVTVNEAPTGVLEFWVRQRPTPVDSLDPLIGALQAGYREFSEGNSEQARAIFAWAVSKFPSSALAHNNLGFTYLALRDPHRALDQFAEAQRLGIVQTEVTEANVGCCLYQLGDYREARRNFDQAMRRSPSLGANNSVLMGIGNQSMRPVWFCLPIDFIALMALNAAWACLREGDVAAARELRVTAAVGTLAADSTSPFSICLTELTSQLAKA